MRLRLICFSFGLVATLASSVQAQDSVRASAAASGASTAAVSVAAASVVVVSAYVGGVLVVESVRAMGDVVEVVFKGAQSASRAVVTVTATAAKQSAIAVGQSVKVIAEGSGYLLVAAGKVLCYVPSGADQKLLHSSHSS